MITIAIPTAESRLHGHFGGCREFTLVQADLKQQKTLGTRTVIPPAHAPGLFPPWLREQGANVVIAGGIGGRALDLLAQQGIEVRTGEPDLSVEQLVAACLIGRLAGTPAGCTRQGDPDHGRRTEPHASAPAEAVPAKRSPVHSLLEPAPSIQSNLTSLL